MLWRCLMNPGQHTVYFLTGHGERDTQNTADKAYTRGRTVLELKNYTVNTLNLLAQNKIPADALSIIVDDPTQPVSSGEMTLLEAYVARGGPLIVMENASLNPDTGKPVDPLADYLSNTWGITINNDIVIDPTLSQIIFAI